MFSVDLFDWAAFHWRKITWQPLEKISQTQLAYLIIIAWSAARIMIDRECMKIPRLTFLAIHFAHGWPEAGMGSILSVSCPQSAKLRLKLFGILSGNWKYLPKDHFTRLKSWQSWSIPWFYGGAIIMGNFIHLNWRKLWTMWKRRSTQSDPVISASA